MAPEFKSINESEEESEPESGLSTSQSLSKGEAAQKSIHRKHKPAL